MSGRQAIPHPGQYQQQRPGMANGNQGQSKVAQALQASRRPGPSGNSPPRQQQQQPIMNRNGSGNGNGMRPLQLRQAPAAQSPVMVSPGNRNGPSPANHHHHHHQNVPTLKVTVPQPAHHPLPPAQQRSPYGPGPGPTRSDYNQFPPPPGSRSPTSPFSGSSDTLIGSSDLHNNKKGSSNDGHWSPNSSRSYAHPPASPSIRNFQLQPHGADLTADPENDRLMPATPSRGGRNDFWKRFSTVVHENEAKEHMAEKVGGKGVGGMKRSRSSWLEKTSNRQRNYRIWVGVVAFLIIAGIAGGITYHYLTKDASDSDTSTTPSTHDFGLGTDSSSSNDTAAESTATDGEVTTTLPEPSSVAPGATLDRRFIDSDAQASPTAAPVLPTAKWERHVAEAMGSGRRRRSPAEKTMLD